MMPKAIRRSRRRPGWSGLLWLALLAWPALAVTSEPERLEWHGRMYDLANAPLEQRYPEGQGRPRFRAQPAQEGDTGRGYAGRWRLEDDRLYLVDIDAWLCGDGGTSETACRRATLAGLFGPTAGQAVFADWFTGELVLSNSQPPRSARGGQDGRAFRITLKSGRVTYIETLGRKPRAAEGG